MDKTETEEEEEELIDTMRWKEAGDTSVDKRKTNWRRWEWLVR